MKFTLARPIGSIVGDFGDSVSLQIYFVIDGGSLLHHLKWHRGPSYRQLIQSVESIAGTMMILMAKQVDLELKIQHSHVMLGD